SGHFSLLPFCLRMSSRMLVHMNVAELVTEHLICHYRRDIDLVGRSIIFPGCPQWWRDYANPTTRIVFDERSPFHGCAPRTYTPKEIPLPPGPPPAELFE
ncbi:DUF4913 domain-containing protein, partial [Kocuria rosea]|nr:DUF4913 domain-containing protein [Kocuria rosea]